MAVNGIKTRGSSPPSAHGADSNAGTTLTHGQLDNNFYSLYGVTNGQVADSKAIIVDSNKDFTGARNGTFTGTVTAGNVTVDTATFIAEVTANYDVTTTTVDWSTGQKQKLTMSGNIATINFTAPTGPCNVVLKIVNTGVFTVTTWGSGEAVYWSGGTAPTVTSNGTDIFMFYFDGTNYYGSAVQDFS